MDSAQIDELFRQHRQPSAPLPSDVQTFDGCLDYFREEANFWSGLGLSELSHRFGELRDRFERAKRSNDENDIRNTLVWVFDRLTRERRFTVGSKLARGRLVAKLAQDDREMAYSALRYFDGTLKDQGLLDPRGFDGAIAAALFEHPEFASRGIDGRVQEFEREIGRARVLGQEAMDARDASRQAGQDFQNEAVTRIDALIAKATADFDATRNSVAVDHEKAKAKMQADMEEIRKNFEELKKAYDKQLSLTEPATYWTELKTQYQWQGFVLAACAGVGVLGLAMYVSNLVYFPPALLTDKSDTYGHIKGALLLARISHKPLAKSRSLWHN